MPSPDVAGHTISLPGAATHRNVARWFNGISRTSVLLVYVGSEEWFSPATACAARSAKSIKVGVTPVAVPGAVTRCTTMMLTWSAGVPTLPKVSSYTEFL